MYELKMDQYFIHEAHGGGFFIKKGTVMGRKHIEFKGSKVRLTFENDSAVISIQDFNKIFKAL